MKKLLVILFFPCLIITCTFSQEGNEQKRELTDSNSYNNPISELTQDQQSAFDALNKLQTNTDEMNRLYSTFANIDQPCYPADTSFEVSQSELLMFMEQFISSLVIWTGGLTIPTFGALAAAIGDFAAFFLSLVPLDTEKLLLALFAILAFVFDPPMTAPLAKAMTF